MRRGASSSEGAEAVEAEAVAVEAVEAAVAVAALPQPALHLFESLPAPRKFLSLLL
jgi:hypothetical protein